VLMIISYLPFVITLLVFAAPVAFLVNIFSAQAAGWALIITLVLAWLVKVSVGDSFAMAAIIAAYYHETKDLSPDPEMSRRLEGVSDKFGELKQKAEAGISNLGNRPTQTPPVTTTPHV